MTKFTFNVMESQRSHLLGQYLQILEENILPRLESYLCNWRRYIDDIFAYVLPEKIDLIIHE